MSMFGIFIGDMNEYHQPPEPNKNMSQAATKNKMSVFICIF